MRGIEDQLLKQLDQFTAFVRARVSDPDLAADVVQESLLKAVKSAGQLRDDENVVAWFYRILRRTIIDLYRRRATNQRTLEQVEQLVNAPPDGDEERTVCACIESLIPTLKPEYAELVRRLDLSQQPPSEVGEALGLSPNNLRVRHHRARQQLRERLEQTCRICAKHGCFDCTCEAGGR